MELELFATDPRELAIEEIHEATAFYTQDPVVEKLLDLVGWPDAHSSIGDTSAGDGAFLVAALRRLLKSKDGLSDQEIVNRVSGVEIHYFAVSEARKRITETLISFGRSEASAMSMARQMVLEADFLSDVPHAPRWDIVSGNPPFRRYALIPTVLREVYEAELPKYAQGDMLHSFMDAALKTMKPGGRIGLVISDRVLFSKCSAKLRGVLGRRLGIAHLERLDGASSFYRPKIRKAGEMPRIHPVSLVLKEHAPGCAALTEAPVYPEAKAGIVEGHRTLAEVSMVRLAPWLGPAGIFVVSEDVARGLPRDLLVPVVDTSNIRGGVLGGETRYAIRTQRDKEPCAAVMAHLEANLHRMPKSKQRLEKRWLPPESFERMDLSKPSLLIPRIATSLRPIRLPAGVLPIDHGLSIVGAGEASLEEIEEELMRPEANEWVRERAPRLENNYYSLTTTLLRELPVRL